MRTIEHVNKAKGILNEIERIINIVNNLTDSTDSRIVGLSFDEYYIANVTGIEYVIARLMCKKSALEHELKKLLEQ